MKATEELVNEIITLLADYFDVSLANDEIYNLFENAIYHFLGDVEFDLMEL